MIETIIATQVTCDNVAFSKMQDCIDIVAYQNRLQPNTAKGFKKTRRIINMSIQNN